MISSWSFTRFHNRLHAYIRGKVKAQKVSEQGLHLSLEKKSQTDDQKYFGQEITKWYKQSEEKIQKDFFCRHRKLIFISKGTSFYGLLKIALNRCCLKMLTILSCTIDLLNSRLENFDFFFRKYDDDFFYLFMMGSCVSFLANLWLFFLNMGPRLMKLRKINYYSLSSKAEKIHIESSFLDPVVDSFQGPFAIEHL